MKIIYSCSGEGLGHVNRALALSYSGLDVHIFTYGTAFAFLKRIGYHQAYLIKGISFPRKNGKINYSKLIFTSINYFINNLKDNVELFKHYINQIQPNLLITDYEPSICHVPRKMPLVSLDNQHRFCLPLDLPISLKLYGKVCGWITKSLIKNVDRVIISSFHYDLLEDVVPGMVYFDREPTNDDYILVYITEGIKEIKPIIYNLIFSTNHKLKIYGISRPYSLDFKQDLLHCHSIIGPAGHQLISEARYLKKPILAIPERNQYEQHINSTFLNKLGFGASCQLKNLNKSVILNFLHTNFTHHNVPNGTNTVIELLRNL